MDSFRLFCSRGLCSSASCSQLGRRSGRNPTPAHLEPDSAHQAAHSLLEHLRPTVVDIGEIQFQASPPTFEPQRGSSVPHQRSAGGRPVRHSYPAYTGDEGVHCGPAPKACDVYERINPSGCGRSRRIGHSSREAALFADSAEDQQKPLNHGFSSATDGTLQCGVVRDAAFHPLRRANSVTNARRTIAQTCGETSCMAPDDKIDWRMPQTSRKH